VDFYPFSDGGVLYLKGSRRIWALNATSALIWCLLDEVDSLDELASRLAATFQIDKSKALQDSGILLDAFEREGLFSGRPYAENPDTDRRWDISATGPGLAEPAQWKARHLFRIAGHHFEFLCQDAGLGAAFAQIMAHFAADSRGGADTRLAVVPASGGTGTWDLFLDGRGYAERLQQHEVLPHIATLVFIRCCEALKAHLLFHAAVVERNGAAVMFPGEAGSGKTTLVAALLTHGCRFYSDELAVLDLGNRHVSPLALPMSIKNGSVRPLEKYYPGLAARAVHLRSDGKKVRYLSPSRRHLPAAGNGSVPIDFIIFPRYIERVQDQLVPIDKFETLHRLAATGSSNRAFTHRDIEAMIALVEGCPCFELAFSDLDQAVALIKQHVWSHARSAQAR
jgi:hypothetical protein